MNQKKLLSIITAAFSIIMPLTRVKANNDIVESTEELTQFEFSTQKLFQDWYIKSYPAPSNHNGEEITEEVYNKRMKKLNLEIEMPFNGDVKSCIEFYITKRRSQISRMLALKEYYLPIFETGLSEHKMPIELKYLPVIESALKPSAVSRAKAGGLWQFMPYTGRSMGLVINSSIDERCDPEESTTAAAKFLKQLYSTYGDWSLVIAAYNCGPGNVNNALRRAGISNNKNAKNKFWKIYKYLPKETRTYVPMFYAAVYVMNYHDEYGISPAKINKKFDPQTIYVNSRLDFDEIAEAINIDVTSLHGLNAKYVTGVVPGNKYNRQELILPTKESADNFLEKFSECTKKTKNNKKASVKKKQKSKTKTNVPKPSTVIVKRGDSLEIIAQRNGTSVDKLLKLNPNIKDRNHIERGAKLRIR